MKRKGRRKKTILIIIIIIIIVIRIKIRRILIITIRIMGTKRTTTQRIRARRTKVSLGPLFKTGIIICCT